MHSVFRKLFLSLFIIYPCLLPVSIGQASPLPHKLSLSDEQAQALLEKLTPEERVGQLFLVTFTGPEAAMASATGAQIYDLIVNYHVGGVILKSDK